MDNLITGSKKNIEHLQNNGDFEFIEADITKGKLEVDSVQYIFGLASPASPTDFEELSEEILRVNSFGTVNMLELAKKNGAKFLMASTSEVYGEPLEHPQKETYFGNVNSFGLRSCYDEGKRFAEAACRVYLKKYDLDLRIIRIFNTYGPRMRTNDGRALITFVAQAIKNEPITVFGDGSHSRSFCYVTDMVEGIYKAMFSEGTKGEIFNLGNPEESSMKDLAKKIKEISGSRSEIVFKPLPPDDPSRRQPDISKAKKVLDWEPEVGLEEGLKKTIGYYKTLI